MKTFCHTEIGRLAHELTLSPTRQRLRQVAGIRRSIELIDPAKEYPYSFVCYQITGYRTRRTADVLLSGKDLVGDLVELLDALTATSPLPAEADEGRLYDVEGLARRFNVSTKTISRWRRRGLAGCWYAVCGGKPRLGFSSRVVRRFVATNLELVQRGSSFAVMTPEEKSRIVARARELVATKKCSLHLVTLQLAEETGRAVETIRYTLRRFDREYPKLALFDVAEQAQPIDEETVIYQAYAAGEGVAELARRFDRPQGQVGKILTRVRARQIASQAIDYVYNAAFDSPGAEREILASSVPAEDRKTSDDLALTRVPDDLPPYLRDLYRTPLLSKADEADLFRRMNFLLHQASAIRSRFAEQPQRAKPADIAAIDEKLEAAGKIKNRIVQANLRLVVSIAKRHLRSNPRANLFELVSDGNLWLMKAVEKFDYGRGFALSTYASWAIMRGFARSIPEDMTRADRYQTGHDEFLSAARDYRGLELPAADEQAPLRAVIASGLEALDERERRVVERRYGLGGAASTATLDEIGIELGLSKERVRQIEHRAMAKLRSTLSAGGAELLVG